MVTAFADDIKEVHELFLAHQEFPQLSKNSPPHSGMLHSSGSSGNTLIFLSLMVSAAL